MRDVNWLTSRYPAERAASYFAYAVEHAFCLVRPKRYSEVFRRSRSHDQRRIRRRCAKLCGVWRAKGRQGKRSAGRAAHLESCAAKGPGWTKPSPSLDEPAPCRGYGTVILCTYTVLVLRISMRMLAISSKSAGLFFRIQSVIHTEWMTFRYSSLLSESS